MGVYLSVHKHGTGDTFQNLEDKLVSLQYDKACRLGGGLQSVDLKMTLTEATYYVRPGNWLVLRGEQGFALAFAYVDTVSAGCTRDSRGALVSDTVHVTCISWFELLMRTQLYVPLGDYDRPVGTIMSTQEWTTITAHVIDQYTLGAVGYSLAFLFRNIARVRLPESMGGELLSEAIDVVYNEDSRAAYAPGRVLEEVAKEGALPAQLTSTYFQAGVADFLTNAFLPDQRLVEMFTSLEPYEPREQTLQSTMPSGRIADDNRVLRGVTVAKTTAGSVLAGAQAMVSNQKAAAQELSLILKGEMLPPLAPEVQPQNFDIHEPSLENNSKLAKFLGRRAVLIYRTPPWRVRPLYESAVAGGSYHTVHDTMLDSLWPGARAAADALNKTPVRGSVKAQAVSIKTDIDTMARGSLRGTPGINPIVTKVSTTTSVDNLKFTVASANPRGFKDLLDKNTALLQDLAARNTNSQQTWLYERDPIKLYPELVRSFKVNWSDAARMNVSTIGIGLGSGGTVESADWAGLPIVVDDSVRNHGARVARPVWPFTATNTSGDYLRSVAAQLMQFGQANHRYGNGTFSLNYTDAMDAATADFVLSLPAGEVVSCVLTDQLDTFYAYADTVSHRWVRAADGSESAETQLTFSRGLWGFEDQEVRNALVPVPLTSPVQVTAGGPVAQPAAAPGPSTGVGTKDAVAYAEIDWYAHVTEADRSSSGAVYKMFVESKFGTKDVKPKPSQVPWWCGVAVSAWLVRAGLNTAHATSWYHVRDVEAFFTYSAHPNLVPSRVKTKIGGRPIEQVYSDAGEPRIWVDATAIRATAVQDLDLRRDDVLLINHYGATNVAQHIVLVRSYDKLTGRLETIEGNAHGLGPSGQAYGTSEDSAVVVNIRLLTVPANLKKLYGYGRLSALDYDKTLDPS